MDALKQKDKMNMAVNTFEATALTESLTSSTATKDTYHMHDKDAKPVHISKEVFKKEKKVIHYPFSLNRNTGQVTKRRISQIEFIGFDDLSDLGKAFRLTVGYGAKSKALKSLLSLVYPKFKDVKTLVIQVNGKTSFTKNKITFDWGELQTILRGINREMANHTTERKNLIGNSLAGFTTSFRKTDRKLTAGELEDFLSKFGSYDKITTKDAESLAKVFDSLPSKKIVATSHFIHTKEKLDIVFFEDVIEKFDQLMALKSCKEEDWQKFFNEYSWVLNHLFPFQVLLRKEKAYLGGKTIENKDGRIVDFLFQHDLLDNMALLEIKIHTTGLLKNRAYREPDVYSMDDELSGGINQCLDQKDIFMKDFGAIENIHDPMCILVIGKKSELNANQRKCFEKIRTNQKNVVIVTFDELQSKLKGLHEVLTGKLSKGKKRKG